MDINAITRQLDNYLTRTKQSSINAVEANAILTKAGLLRDSKDRPGKPLRDLLRDGKLPHAYQAGGKGSGWSIPHSSSRNTKSSTSKVIIAKLIPSKEAVKASQIPSSDTVLLEKILMNEKNFKKAVDIDNLVPHGSGLYCIRIDDIEMLPKGFSCALAERKHNIIYIGIASESLNRRFLNQELRANGHGTFFRSLGAALGFRPQKGSLVKKKNKRNYKFSASDEQKIIKWINNNLKVNWIEFAGDYEGIETELISKYRPLMNIAKNSSALKLLSDLRKICVQTANEM